MNTLLEGPGQMTYYTDLALIFQALGGRQNEFNWLITDLDACLVGKDWGKALPEFLLKREPQCVSGQHLSRVVEENSIQFIWAVLSGFRSDISVDVDHLDVRPYADGNRMFWSECPSTQHPQASVEIVCWDSTLVLLLSKDMDMSVRFRAFFPDAMDLDQYNRQRTQGQT